MGRKRIAQKKVIVSFSMPEEQLRDFDTIIGEFNKRNSTDFSRSQVLQILVLNYNVKVGTDILKEMNNKEDN